MRGRGGWDSNPGPADYESSPPVALVTGADLGRHRTPRLCSNRFWHVFGTIKVAACLALWPWSQIHGLSANMVVPRLEGAPRDDLNSDTQEFLKIVNQADVIKKRGTRLEIHEQV